MNNEFQIKIEEHDIRRHANYTIVRDWLLNYITQHNLRPGERLPSERILGDTLGFSRDTIAKGISQLVEEGILVRKTRSGTFISGKMENQTEADTEDASHVIGISLPWYSLGPDGEITGETVGKARLPFKSRSMAASVLEGIISVAKKQNCQLVVRSYQEPLTESSIIENIPNEHADGWIIMPGYSPEVKAGYAKLAEGGLPMVFVDQYLEDVPVDRVVTDNYTAARDAVRYLIAKGHRRIAHFTDFTPASSVVEREAGYKAALEEAGIPYDDDIVRSYEIVRSHEVMRNHPWSLDLALKYCWTLPDPVTAVFCMNGEALLTALQAARRWQISVPEDVELIGFFDELVPDWAPTPFTRVVQDTIGMGRNAMQLLLERISGEAPSEPRHVALPVQIVPDTINRTPLLR